MIECRVVRAGAFIVACASLRARPVAPGRAVPLERMAHFTGIGETFEAAIAKLRDRLAAWEKSG